MTNNPTREEIERLRTIVINRRWTYPLVPKINTIFDMALATASPAGEGPITQLIERLRKRGEQFLSTPRHPTPARGRYPEPSISDTLEGEAADTLAHQRSEIASLRERLEKADGELDYARTLASEAGALTIQAEARAEAAESRLAELQQAKLSVEEQNRGLVEQNARFYADREAMRRAVEKIAEHKTYNELAASMGQHFHYVDFATRYDELILAARALTAAQGEGGMAAECDCFGGSGLHASTHGGGPGGRRYCDMCGKPVRALATATHQRGVSGAGS